MYVCRHSSRWPDGRVVNQRCLRNVVHVPNKRAPLALILFSINLCGFTSAFVVRPQISTTFPHHIFPSAHSAHKRGHCTYILSYINEYIVKYVNLIRQVGHSLSLLSGKVQAFDHSLLLYGISLIAAVDGCRKSVGREHLSTTSEQRLELWVVYKDIYHGNNYFENDIRDDSQ